MPSRWYAGGRGLDDFRETMLHDEKIAYLFDFIDSKDCFPSVNIAGGVCYFLRSEQYNGDCTVITHSGDKKYKMSRKLNEYDIFIRDNVGVAVVRKLLKQELSFMSEKVQSLSPFGLRTFVRGEKKSFKNSVPILTSKGIGYVKQEEILKNQDLITKYKVIIGRLVPNNGEVGVDPSKGYKAITKSSVVDKGMIITESYLLVNHFETEQEAINCAEFLMLKFPRFLMRITYSSMNVNKANFRFVPELDFTKKWQDKELYDMFNLTEEEISYIERNMRDIKYAGIISENTYNKDVKID